MRIFLASSNELKHEREYLAGVVFYLGRLFHDLGRGLRVELVKWEYLDSSIGIEHKQNEYNRELVACDATVVLFWKKLGEYTETEFLSALNGFQKRKMPRKLAVFFKETCETPTSQLTAYRLTLTENKGVLTGLFSTDVELRERFLELVFTVMCDLNSDFVVPTDSILHKYGLK